MSPQLLLLRSLVPDKSNRVTSTVGHPMSSGVLLGLVLATLLCAGVTLLLYRRSPKRRYWYASAAIGGILLCCDLLYFSAISQQLALILSFVLAVLISVVAILLYQRSGASTKEWYAYIGAGFAFLLFFGLRHSSFIRPGWEYWRLSCHTEASLTLCGGFLELVEVSTSLASVCVTNRKLNGSF